MRDLEEGDKCEQPDCDGVMIVSPDPSKCRCHISPPCDHCTSEQTLVCNKCGERP